VRATRFYALCYSFALLGSLLTTCLAVRVSLGHWPQPSDHPNDIGWWVSVPHAVTLMLLSIGVPSFPVVISVLIYDAWRYAAQRKQSLMTAAVAVLFVGLAIALVRWDPHHLVDWFMD